MPGYHRSHCNTGRRSAKPLLPKQSKPGLGHREEDGTVEEDNLTERQRTWLQASREIGPGRMTETERQRLEELYAEMLPKEQQELARYIEEKFGKKEDKSEDPIEKMAERVWLEPSKKMRETLAKTQAVKPPPLRDKS